jgi:hypothetical protein
VNQRHAESPVELERPLPRPRATVASPSGVILGWQRTAGNAAVTRMLSGKRVLAREDGLKKDARVIVTLEDGKEVEGVIVAVIAAAKRYRVEHAKGTYAYPYDRVRAIRPAAAALTTEKPEKEEKDSGKEEKTASTKRDVDPKVYGEALNHAVIKIFEAKPAFEASDAEKKYNPKFWRAEVKLVEGESCTDLHVRDVDHVAEAIDDLVASAGSYTFDCAAFVQVVNLYAWRQADRNAANSLRHAATSTRARTFTLSEHDSTGLRHKRLYYREGQNAPLMVRTQASDREKEAVVPYPGRDMDLLAECPVGSRVSFKNYSRGVAGSNWERENTVKIAPGRYAAFPLGGNETAASVMRKLAMRGLGDVLGQKYNDLSEEDKKQADAVKDDADKLVDWILANREKISDEILHDDLDDHIEHWIALEAVEVYEVTPEKPA